MGLVFQLEVLVLARLDRVAPVFQESTHPAGLDRGKGEPFFFSHAFSVPEGPPFGPTSLSRNSSVTPGPPA